MKFYTKGVYGSSELEFFDELLTNEIDTFCDIRQRRGVRGSKYSFVNSKQLQIKLKNLGISYFHYLGLAPTKEIRMLQKQADLNNQELKRERKTLGAIFIDEYKSKIVNQFNFYEFFEDLKKSNAKKIVLFCVEESHQACHRSLIAEKLSNEYDFNVINI